LKNLPKAILRKKSKRCENEVNVKSVLYKVCLKLKNLRKFGLHYANVRKCAKRLETFRMKLTLYEELCSKKSEHNKVLSGVRNYEEVSENVPKAEENVLKNEKCA
jgi:hypothetical protein